MKLTSLYNNGISSVVLIGTLLQINATLADPSKFVPQAMADLASIDRVSTSANSSVSVTAQTVAPVPSIAANVATMIAGSGAGSARTSSKENARSPLGINLAGVTSYSAERPFVDVFKTTHPWFSNAEGKSWAQGGDLALTAEGWVASLRPGQYATTGVLDGDQRYPTGNYTLLYDGQGKIEIRAMSNKGLTTVSEAPGRSVFKVTTETEGLFVHLRETNPANPVRNIRFIMPGHEKTYQTQPFNPQFLKALSRFKSIRFMDWQKANGSKLANWSDRTTPLSATQAVENGVALEHMIQLANTLQADPWFTIPIRASDDFVRQFATLVRDKLDPSLKAHIEYSNEVWNFGFEQAGYVRDQGVRLGLDRDQYLAGTKYYSQRSVEIFKIFETVMGGTSRIDRVLAGQSVNTWSGNEILAWKDAYKHADTYAIAPYFDGRETLLNGEKGAQIAQMSEDQVLDILQADIRGKIKDDMVSNAKLARKYGIQLKAYEGGQQLTSFQFGGYEPQITKLYTNVNRNPRMGDLYTEYLNNWKASGGGLFSHYNDIAPPNKYGVWGVLEYLGQDPKTAPKYQALIRYIDANPTSK
ncbi:hypothetical protein H6F76_12220 [Leptolyngbya sp. FACHB-321]|uniref:hypothetical protein n=1 Tax=Leptolyngbya sp. FACHB-321 TaxID=2692807 RepID=UPI001682F7DB|nr:hypothetical protein [Leptolyngbya sp. FACHB-321]MBD2035785.1 hypothetical protein [Leptolyngbya sp. FACHB-321]